MSSLQEIVPPFQDLRATIERIRSRPFPGNKREIENKVIMPLLNAVGWDAHGDDVRYQYRVGGTRNRSRYVVDIALLGRRGALCLIEVKSPNEPLERNVNQLLGLVFYEEVVLCVVTNGREWCLYLPREVGEPETRRFVQWNLGTEALDVLEEEMLLFLSKVNLESGQAERAGRRRLLDMRRSAQREGAPDSQESETFSLSEDLRERLRRTRSPSSRIYGVRLWGKFQKAQHWVDTYWLLVNEIYTRHPGGFFERISNLRGSRYPWFAYQKEACSTPSSQRWACISCRSFCHRFITYRACLFCHSSFPEDGRPIYVHVNGSSVVFKKKAKRLLETFGYPGDDPGIWEIVTE